MNQITLEQVLDRVKELKAVIMFTPMVKGRNTTGWQCTIVLNEGEATGLSEHPVAAALGALAIVEANVTI